MDSNASKGSEEIPMQWIPMDPIGTKWNPMDLNGPQWIRMFPNNPIDFQCIHMNLKESQGTPMDPNGSQ